MATVQDDITAVSTADQAVADANSGVQAAQAALTAAQAQVTTAQAADTAADLQLAADLQASGPVFEENTDGTVTVYQADASKPAGFSAVKAQPAGSVGSTTPTPSPSSTSSS